MDLGVRCVDGDFPDMICQVERREDLARDHSVRGAIRRSFRCARALVQRAEWSRARSSLRSTWQIMSNGEKILRETTLYAERFAAASAARELSYSVLPPARIRTAVTVWSVNRPCVISRPSVASRRKQAM